MTTTTVHSDTKADAQTHKTPVSQLHVVSYTNGILGPSQAMLGPLADGGTLIAGTPPGCWGPMITPAFQGGHEVTQPVAIEGAEVGDAVALKIQRMRVTSHATSSGVMQFVEGRYHGDPFVAKFCSSCGTEHPASHVEGIGCLIGPRNGIIDHLKSYAFRPLFWLALQQDRRVLKSASDNAALSPSARPGMSARASDRIECCAASSGSADIADALPASRSPTSWLTVRLTPLS